MSRLQVGVGTFPKKINMFFFFTNFLFFTIFVNDAKKKNIPFLASPHFDEEEKISEKIANESNESFDEEESSYSDTSDVVVDLF